MQHPGQQLLDAERPSAGPATAAPDELAARRTLKGQIARLERELSGTVAERFPFIALPGAGAAAPSAGPRLQDLGSLERSRDELAGRVQALREAADERTERERRARELLDGMRLEPGRYRNVRLPVSELGQGGCGVWRVRPRLGIIGMLAGWWELTLSSGCPLPRGPRPRRGPSRKD